MALSVPSQSKIPTKTQNSAPPVPCDSHLPRCGGAVARRAVLPALAEKVVRPLAETVVWWWRWRGV